MILIPHIRVAYLSLVVVASLFLAPVCLTPSVWADPPFTEEERAEVRAFASGFWRARGYSDVPIVGWNAPILEGGTWALSDREGFNPFLESLRVFDALYSGRIGAARAASAPYYAITDLFHDDAQVFAAFRWHTVTGELFTAVVDEPEAAMKHAGIALCFDPDAPHFEVDSSGVSADGVVWSLGLRVLTLPLESGGGDEPTAEGSLPIIIAPAVVDDRLREAMDVWSSCFGRFGSNTFPDGETIPGLFHRDGYGVGALVVPDITDTFPILILPVPVLSPGFDCDDFASAFIYWFRQRFTEQELQGMELHIYQVGEGLWGHSMVVIRVGSVYWVIDLQTGEVRGPIEVPTNGSSWPDPDLLVTDPQNAPAGSRGYGRSRGAVFHGLPKFYPAGDPPFYEPEPWHTSPSMRQRFDGYLERLRDLRQRNNEDASCLEGVDWQDFSPVVP